MLTKRRKGIDHVSLVLAVFTLAFIGSSCVHAVETTAHKALKWKIDDFRMYLEPVLKESILKEITAEDSNDQIVQLGNWLRSPLEVRSLVANRNIRIRFEEDFLVVWYHSPVSLFQGKKTPMDVIRQSVNSILGEAFVIGGDDTLIAQGTGSSANAKTELVMAPWPREIPGTKSITCRYGPISRRKRDWKLLVSAVSVLVKDKDAIIVMEKLKARGGGYGIKYIYEGLIAAKARLDKEETESAKSKHVLGRNIIFGEETDIKDISDRLLNGCMWPIDDELLLGAKNVGSARKLRPKSSVKKRDAKSK